MSWKTCAFTQRLNRFFVILLRLSVIPRPIWQSCVGVVLWHTSCNTLSRRKEPLMKQLASLETNGKAARNGESFQLKTILVPIDFSADSMFAFRYASRLAELAGAKVIALNVVVNPVVY